MWPGATDSPNPDEFGRWMRDLMNETRRRVPDDPTVRFNSKLARQFGCKSSKLFQNQAGHIYAQRAKHKVLETPMLIIYAGVRDEHPGWALHLHTVVDESIPDQELGETVLGAFGKYGSCRAGAS
jgi:hypothetical protein